MIIICREVSTLPWQGLCGTAHTPLPLQSCSVGQSSLKRTQILSLFIPGRSRDIGRPENYQ